MITKQIYNKFHNIINKLYDHPALPGIIFPYNNVLWYSLQEVDIHGYTSHVKKDGIAIYYNIKNYRKYKTLFDKKFKELNDETYPTNLVSIHIPYVDYFGKSWSPHHFEYWGEISFYVYQSTNYSFKECFDLKNWQPYQGVNSSALSYEELIIKIGNKFLKKYGNKIDDDFLTEEEKTNHKKHQPFLKPFLNLDHNLEYIDVNIGEINHRWLKEFIKTDYCEKYWKDEFDNLLKGIMNANS